LWNPLCGGLTVAEISWAHVWLTRCSQMELRSDSCNRWVYNSLVAPFFTNGAKKTPLTAPSVRRGNPWDTSKVAVRHLKNLVLLNTI